MLSKICTRCGKRIPLNSVCKCSIGKRGKHTQHHRYNEDIKKFYSTSEWKKARERCIAECFGIDIYSFFVLNKIEYGEIVHHIIPIVNDYSERLRAENLIYLTETNHKLIHSLYENSYDETVKLLKTLLKMAKTITAPRG